MSEQLPAETAEPAKKRRAPRATIAAAATKLVECLRRARYSDGMRAAEVLALALERDGDPIGAAAVREAAANGSLQPFPRHTVNDAGEWREPTAELDELVLGEHDRAAFEQLVREVEAAPRFIAAGIDAPTRIFFHGPSGTGKTLAAHHLAARLGVPLLIGRLEQLVDSHMGESAKKIGSLFAAAAATPCVVFIDEIDGLVGPRGSNQSAAEREMGRTTSSLLQQLDMLPPTQVVIAASNFPGEIDDALYRRFPTRLPFAIPGPAARAQMLRNWWRKLELADRVDATVADTAGFSPSDLRARAMEIARAFILGGHA